MRLVLFSVLASALAALGAQAGEAGHPLHTLYRRASGNVNQTLVETAKMSLMASQRASWEQGTAQTAWTEYDAAQWSVFAGSGSGPPYRPAHENLNAGGVPMAVLSMAYHSVTAQDSLGKLASAITGDENATSGSAVDSASTGESVLLGAWLSGQINSSSGYWIEAAERQLHYLLQVAPRTPSGAISHRSANRQLWSDAVYMLPPFLASYGLYTRNQSLLQAAYDQVRLYRDGLRLSSGPAQGMWGHILIAGNRSTWQDASAWATGEGWVAGGMLRTVAAIAQSPYSSQMASQKRDLIAWTKEILDAAYPFLNSQRSLFHNYINDSSTFLDTAGSAFIAYATFRLASMDSSNNDHIQTAEQIYQAVQNQLSPIGSFSSPVVNALSFSTAGTTSPESLAFVMLLEAARRDYHAGNVTGIDGPGTGAKANAGTPFGGPATTFTIALAAANMALLVV